MSGATDNGMVKIMGIVIGCLAVIAVLCVLAARLLSSGSDDYDDALKRNALVQRLQPVAAVRTSADELPADATQVAAADVPAKSGEELVSGACAACHVAGVAGAPKLDDAVAWAERREAGLDALVASVINGKGAMPARGGSAYSDDEIKLAVQQIAGFEVEEAPAEEAAAEDAPEAGAEAAATGTDAAAAETDTAAAQSAVPAADAAATESAVEEPAADSADAEGDAGSAEPAESEEAAGSEEAAADPAEMADALVVGQVPDGLTDNIKTTVDGVCAGCHLAAVAGAPAIGDKEAWQLRADKGLAALTSSVINGLNVMPARGGSALTDEEIPVAIQYLMSK